MGYSLGAQGHNKQRIHWLSACNADPGVYLLSFIPPHGQYGYIIVVLKRCLTSYPNDTSGPEFTSVMWAWLVFFPLRVWKHPHQHSRSFILKKMLWPGLVAVNVLKPACYDLDILCQLFHNLDVPFGRARSPSLCTNPRLFLRGIWSSPQQRVRCIHTGWMYFLSIHLDTDDCIALLWQHITQWVAAYPLVL